VRIKRTQEIGRVHAADGGVVYVLMDETDETKLFSARADEDAYIELVMEAAGTISQEP
jgi:ERCC4-related helicase